MKEKFDVVIIGGGPAGLTAALTLGRAGRTVLVYDDNQGRNFATLHMQNFPSRDGTPPLEFRNQIKEDLGKYKTVSFKKERVIEIEKIEKSFLINNETEATKILFAHGVKDILPDISGLKEAWGKNVFHCPYCHGHEFKNQRIGVIAESSQYADHMIPLLLGLSDKVTLFTNGSDITLSGQLSKHITIHSEKIISYKNNIIQLENKKEILSDCLVLRPPQELSFNLGVKLGCELNETGLYKVDAEYMTTVEGIYAAGDIVDPRQSVLNACAYGQLAGALINFSILKEKFFN